MASSVRKTLFGVVTAAVVGYAGFVGFLYAAQESLIFNGHVLPADHEFRTALPYEEVSITSDGATLNGLLFRQPNPRGLVFFLRGNSGNLQSWTTGVEFYQRVNYDMFMFDYRGSGKTIGDIENEAQLHADVRAAWDAIAPRYEDKPIVLYGRSLGAAFATRLATQVEPDLLVLVSPFRNMLSMAQARYPFVPTQILRYPFRNDEAIAEVTAPVLLVHGDRDGFIPLSHSEALLERASAPTELLVIEGAGHNDIHRFATYLDGLAAALPDETT